MLTLAICTDLSIHSNSKRAAGKSPVQVLLSFSLLGNATINNAAVQNLVDSVRLTSILVDAPPNELNTTTFTETARVVAHQLGVGFEVIAGEELREKGYGGLWGVGQAASNLPALAILTYRGTAANAKTIAMVGKGFPLFLF